MKDQYLFRFDGSRDNDDFFSLSSRDCRLVYSGTPVKIGPGWIPDFLEVKSVNGGKDLIATIIELEATRTAAMESGRKYLPEDPSSIIDVFKAYLESILTQCRTTSDPRGPELEKLLSHVLNAERIEVFTAGGLRDTPNLVEVLPLLHQTVALPSQSGVTSTGKSERFEAKGPKVLSREEANNLRRAVRILDALITGQDESGASYHSWVNPRRMRRNEGQRLSGAAELNRLLHKPPSRGLRLDLDRLVDDLHSVWSHGPHLRPSKPQIAASLEEYFPIVQSIRSHTAMRAVFQEARQILAKHTQ